MSTLTATPALSADDERALIARAQDGDRDAAAALVTAQIRWLRAEARKYGAASGVAADDLVSAGIEAFLAAVATFDPTRGARLWTHAHTSVRLAMAEEVAAYSSSISIPGRSLRRYRRAVRETSSVSDARALAQSRDGMDPATFDAVHAALTGGASLDAAAVPGTAHASKDGGAESVSASLTSAAALLGSRGPAPESAAVSRDLARRALAALSPEHRAAVTAVYIDGRTVAEAAEELGVPAGTVKSRCFYALRAMRAALA